MTREEAIRRIKAWNLDATRLGIQFGITPASRAKIAAMISGNDKKYDEFAEFE